MSEVACGGEESSDSAASDLKLFFQDSFFEGIVGIEEEGHRGLRIFADDRRSDMAYFGKVGAGRHQAFIRLKDFEKHLGRML